MKIIVFGSTGKLGTKLLNFTHSNQIKINAITCFKNKKKILFQKSKFNIKHSFVLNNEKDISELKKFLRQKFDIIYFLDFSAISLIYIDILIKYNRYSTFAIANKEMIIAGGKLLFNKLNNSKNKFIPLDSEHFSLKNNISNNRNIKKLYITASGGPFFFSKKSNFRNVKLNEVLNHPKWKMGINNTIDSSNFINKILEIYELSYIYNLDLSKIDFLVSRSAYIHSIIEFNDGITSLNCYKNDMIIPLLNPLSDKFNLKLPNFNNEMIFDLNNFSLSKKYDKRFIIFKNYKLIKNLNHLQQINLLLSNNYAHELYLSKYLRYNEIIPYIIKRVLAFNISKDNLSFSSFNQILNYMDDFKKYLRNE